MVVPMLSEIETAGDGPVQRSLRCTTPRIARRERFHSLDGIPVDRNGTVHLSGPRTQPATNGSILNLLDNGFATAQHGREYNAQAQIADTFDEHSSA